MGASEKVASKSHESRLRAALFFYRYKPNVFGFFNKLKRAFGKIIDAYPYTITDAIMQSIKAIDYKLKGKPMNIAKKAYCRGFQFCFKVAIPLLPYRIPKTRESISLLPAMLRRRGVDCVLIVTDKGIVKAGLLDILTKVLDSDKIRYAVYDETIPNPTIDNVEAARALYIESHAQAIIALGGGSAMDCAKACGARIVQPWMSVKQMGGILKVFKKLPCLIAIPTTAGTGSETTLAAVITDAKTHHKVPINSFPLIPRYAILDHRLTTGLPKHITSTTGMDALTHAVEAYIGGSTTKDTRENAIKATRLIHQYLYRAYQDGTDAEARQNMLHAAYYAGAAFSKSYVGYVHAVAHSLGGQYGTPHGLANAVLLPIVLREYGVFAHAKLAQMAREAGVIGAGKSDEETANLFIDWIEEMNDKMGIPRKLSGIEEADIEKMAEHADAEANPLYPVPVLMDKEELKKFYHLVKE